MFSSLQAPNVDTEYHQNNHGTVSLQPTRRLPSSLTNTWQRPCLHKSINLVLPFLCMFMHGFFVLFHPVLLALSISAVEHHFVISDYGAWISVFGASTQAFYTLYCVILVYLVQRLTLYRNLIQHQKLTVLHDNVNAWTGLGSVLQCLWQQSSTTGSFWWIVSITTYLGCVFALHVASSSILQLQTFTAATNMSATTLSHWPGPDVDMMGLQWHTISAIVPSLGHFTSSLNAGLSGATLYDTVQADGVIGNATVDATTFRAECGLLRNSDFSFIPELNANQFGNYVVDPQVSGRQQTMKWLARLVPPYQDQLAACESMSLIFPGSTIVFMMSIDVDDSLKSATVQHMNWEYQPDGPQAPIISTVLDTHLIACNMYVERHTATVDMGTG
ncbi:hypothetical protein BDR07DRAFT_311309 [Suillus spraguei]|nr:hypothetical protein BDR07DRAFT_311309 [Suillus spraguei]